MCCCDGCKFIENLFGCVSKSMRVSMCGKASASQIDWMCEPSSWSDGPNIAWTPDSICWHTVAHEFKSKKRIKMLYIYLKCVNGLILDFFLKISNSSTQLKRDCFCSSLEFRLIDLCARHCYAFDGTGLSRMCSRRYCGVDWTTCSILWHSTLTKCNWPRSLFAVRTAEKFGMRRSDAYLSLMS